jgi:hypothetical protein
LGCAPSAVRKHITILETLPSTPLPAKKRTVRMRKVTVNMKIRMSLSVKKKPVKTTRKLRNEVFGWSGILVRRI